MATIQSLVKKEVPSHHTWLASSLFLTRNISKYYFPEKLEEERKKKICTIIEKAIIEGKQPLTIFPMSAISDKEKEYLREQFFMHRPLNNNAWGIALEEHKKCLITLLDQDHMQWEVTDFSEEPERAWNHLVHMETILNKYITMAFSPRFGFLTANPKYAGTGFVFSIFLQPSALIHTGKLESYLETQKEENVLWENLQGEQNNFTGDIIVIHNRFTLGVTEEQILSFVKSFALKLLFEENAAREKLKKKENTSEIKDKISRAYAILKHSYQMNDVEILNAIGLLKLGITLGWVQNISIQELHQLFLHIRSSYLLNMETSSEILHKRAEQIHQSIEKSTLNI